MVEHGDPSVLAVDEPAVQVDLLAHAPLSSSLECVAKYSTGPQVLQHEGGLGT
jgi:ABC-type molybdenum transport system ATPase subunit/photorepair protein PhrA